MNAEGMNAPGADFVAAVSEGYHLCGVPRGARVAVALSGGADSVALLLATQAGGYATSALHCNFHLRDEESNRDEQFVASLCRRRGVPLRTVDFDVERRMNRSGESVEMACRELRYEWFARQLESGDFDFVAIAHQSDDDAETLMLNLMRGTGLRGMAGMPRRRERFVRPMMELSREQVLAFLNSAGETYVTDSTNLANDYRRNRVRNIILPAIYSAAAQARSGVAGTLANLRRDLQLLRSLVAAEQRRLTRSDGSIDLEMLCATSDTPHLLLFQILRRMATSGRAPTLELACNILEARKHSGAKFPLGQGCSFEIYRGALYYRSAPVPNDAGSRSFHLSELLSDPSAGKGLPLPLRVEVVDAAQFRPDRSGRVLWLSEEVLKAEGCFTLRRWKQADRMAPFGMRGTRLLSDMFTEAGLPPSERQTRWVLLLSDRILWVPGLRASRHFSIPPEAKRVVRIEML